jgi:tRNA-intron endonuclease
MISGRLVENRIIIWDVSHSRTLFGSGYYGKPLGIQKPKGTEFDAPLVLDLIEGCYLVEKNKLKVFHIEGKPVAFARIKKISTLTIWFTRTCERKATLSHRGSNLDATLLCMNRDQGLITRPI